MKNDMLACIGTDSSALELAAKAVLREALDGAAVHPCDEGDDVVAVKTLPPAMQVLFQALRASTSHKQPVGSNSFEV